MANYGIGGVYGHHTDSAGELGSSDDPFSDMAVNGDRLATSMVYLSDVTAGGATVYPMLGLAIWPRRGDMAFWFNNDRNGVLDGYTMHGGCPVLAGSKWITNKWIRSRAQFQLYPCTLAPDRVHHMRPLQNDICAMTKHCDKAGLFQPEKAARGFFVSKAKEEAASKKE